MILDGQSAREISHSWDRHEGSSAVPSGLVEIIAAGPNVETLGYFQMSLRDGQKGFIRRGRLGIASLANVRASDLSFWGLETEKQKQNISVIRPSLRDLGDAVPAEPNVETLGYFRMSLRDGSVRRSSVRRNSVRDEAE